MENNHGKSHQSKNQGTKNPDTKIHDKGNPDGKGHAGKSHDGTVISDSPMEDQAQFEGGDAFQVQEMENRSPALGDMLRKLLTAGVTAAFMTEESIRAYLGEIKLPKEVMSLLLQSASKSKDELMNRVSREMINIISKIDFVKEASRFVEEHKFRVSAEIEVVRKDKN